MEQACPEMSDYHGADGAGLLLNGKQSVPTASSVLEVSASCHCA